MKDRILRAVGVKLSGNDHYGLPLFVDTIEQAADYAYGVANHCQINPGCISLKILGKYNINRGNFTACAGKTTPLIEISRANTASTVSTSGRARSATPKTKEAKK